MSTLRTENIETPGGSRSITTDNLVQGTTRAWGCINHNSPPNVKKSFNISSVVDASSGATGINFAVSFSDANYAVASDARPPSDANDAGLVSCRATDIKTASRRDFRVCHPLKGNRLTSPDVGFIFCGN